MFDVSTIDIEAEKIISNVIKKDIDVLELSQAMKDRLHSGNFNTIEDILIRKENDLQKIPYIGSVRARKISNLVYNAILEYISG